MNAILQASIDLDATGPSPGQRAIGWGVAILLVLGLVVLFWRSRYAGLPREHARRVSAFRQAKAAARLRQARFRSAAALRDGTATIQGLFDGEAPERPSTRTALRTASGELQTQLAPHLARLPLVVRRWLALAAWIAVFGTLAVGTALIMRGLESGRGVDLAWFVGGLTSSTRVLLDAAVGLVVAFPGGEVLWALVFSGGVVAATWLYQHWYVLAALLGAGAAVIWTLDRRVDAPTERLYYHRLDLLVLAGSATLAVWVAGVFPVALARVLGAPELGATAGVILAGVVALGCLLLGGWRLWGRVRSVATHHADATRPVLWYLVSRRLFGGFALLAIPYGLVYFGVGLTKLPQVIRAWFRAPPAIQLATLAIAALLFGLLAYELRESWGAIRAGLAESAADQELRMAAWAYGLPSLAVIATYTVATPVLQAPVVAGVLAVSVGLAGTRVATGLRALQYRVEIGSRDEAAQRVTVEAAVLEVGGEEHYYVRVNGTEELLAPDREQAVATAQEIGAALFDAGEIPPTLPSAYFDVAERYGIVDYDDVTTKELEKAAKQLYHALRSDGPAVDREIVEDALSDVPEPVRAVRLQTAVNRGNIRVLRHGDRDRFVLRNDPRAR